MTCKFPNFTLDTSTSLICDYLLKLKAFADQAQLEKEAMELLIHAVSVTNAGEVIFSIDVNVPSVREVKTNCMTRMSELGLVGTNEYHDALKQFQQEPQAFIDDLVARGIFTSFEDFCEQSLILVAFAFTELRSGRFMASVTESTRTYSEWTFPLSERISGKKSTA